MTSATAAAETVDDEPAGLLARPPADGHLVQFYEDDQFLGRVVCDYLTAGLEGGESLIVVATEARRQLFTEGLEARGFDVVGARRRGQLLMLDAEETLAHLMVGGMPDWARFHALIGSAMNEARARADAPIRAYGEMVDVLWRAGQARAAIRLEELWNDLGRMQSFTLLCAYVMGNFYKESHGQDFQRVCGAHSHVIPSDARPDADRDDLLRQMSLLQQRARALENEIAHRRQLEEALRDALADRRRAEEALRAQNEELARTVRFSEMFVGILGHDLRNPLSAVTTAASLLVRRAESDRVSRPAARILSSGQRMSRMIDQLLDLTRIRLGKGIPLERSRIDLVEICRMAVDEIDGAEQMSRVRVEPIGDLVGWWDGDRLSQLVSNLLGNALAHGAKEVPIILRIDGRVPSRVVMEVHNGGCIPADVLPVIFDATQSGTNVKREGSSGLGLGLYISEQIVIAHGGTLEVRSTPEDGTCFTAALPRNLHQAAPAFGEPES